MRSFVFRETEYDAIIFDCDGVLLASNELKIDAFRTASSELGFDDSTVDAFSGWQRLNFGISRFRAFARLMAGDFGAVPAAATHSGLIDAFARRVRLGYATIPEAPGLRACIAKLRGVPRFVASGSDEMELRDVFEERGMTEWFSSVRGSPTPKSDLIAEIMTSNEISRPIFLGDAHADADAAQANSIDFVFISALSTARESMTNRANDEGFPQVQDLAAFADELNSRESSPPFEKG
jgi:phosphoglycolate phosphatase-like HAD superfamily hydrolase